MKRLFRIWRRQRIFSLYIVYNIHVSVYINYKVGCVEVMLTYINHSELLFLNGSYSFEPGFDIHVINNIILF